MRNEVICKRYSLVASYYDDDKTESFGYYDSEDEAIRKATVLMKTNPDIATFEIRIKVVRIAIR